MEEEKVVKKPSDAEEWKNSRTKTEFIELPSGHTVEIKSELSLLDEAFAGRLSLPLLSSVYESSTKMAKIAKEGFANVKDEEITKFGDMMRQLATVAIVNPIVVLSKPKKNEMDVNLIAAEDLLFLFNYFNMKEGAGAKKLQPFSK